MVGTKNYQRKEERYWSFHIIRFCLCIGLSFQWSCTVGICEATTEGILHWAKQMERGCKNTAHSVLKKKHNSGPYMRQSMC